MPKSLDAMQMSAAFQNMLGNAASGQGNLTTLDQQTYDDRWNHHTFTYSPEYIVGGFGSPKGTAGGPQF